MAKTSNCKPFSLQIKSNIRDLLISMLPKVVVLDTEASTQPNLASDHTHAQAIYSGYLFI